MATLRVDAFNEGLDLHSWTVDLLKWNMWFKDLEIHGTVLSLKIFHASVPSIHAEVFTDFSKIVTSLHITKMT